MINPEFEKMLASTGDSRLSELADVLENTKPEVSVRLNPAKGGTDAVSALLPEGEVEWWSNGVYLGERPKFTLDPALHQGRYYVQDASSMVMSTVAARIARQLANELQEREEREERREGDEHGEAALPLLWLDACAAPGGKTTAAIDGLPSGSLVVANEYDYQRAEILKENVAKWGCPAAVVSRGDTARFRKLKATFDVVAVDAPCSGEGMMRKDMTARSQWTPALVEECAARQREILGNLWDALRPGGFMVYSTCTFNTAENELMVDWLRSEFGAETVDPRQIGSGIGNLDPVDGEIAIEGVAPTGALRFIPGRIRGEGLFLALLRKPGIWTPASATFAPAKKMKKGGKSGKNNPGKGKQQSSAAFPADWIGPATDGYSAVVLPTEEGFRLFPAQWEQLLPALLRELQVISAGVEAASIKGKDIIPTQQLALSNLLRRGAFPEHELSRQEAINYLAKENLLLPDTLPRGFVLLTYAGYPLGFVKNLGNRSNNLYPKEWRIRNA